jgi:hypothetical protein
VALCVLAPVSVPAAQVPTEKTLGRVWLDADKNPLPFQSDDELLNFMRSAPIISEKLIGVGVNESKKVLLEKDGIRLHCIFREVDLRKRNEQVGGRIYLDFADSYLFEGAAYELARMLGIHHVPPVVLRKIDRRHGTLQVWIEDVLDKESEGFKPPGTIIWVSQLWEMYFFDALIFNIDRNQGNMLVDEGYRLWMIDHTRAFQMVSELLEPEKINRVNRLAWERLVNLTKDDLQAALSDYLEKSEINSLWRRRQLLIDYVKALVEKRGAKVVFY